VLRYPAPAALFSGFGQTGMTFDVRAHVADILEGGAVASDIRIAIDKAFKERVIGIPTIQPPPPAPKRK
jgi:small-conductance mechanosensitive channel